MSPIEPDQPRRIAVVHDWLTTYAGAERVLEQILLLYPEADVFAVCDFLPDSERGFLGGRQPRTTFIQKLPGARKHYRNYLSLMPLAIEQLDVSAYDLVISSSHAVAKGVLTGPDQLHVSYVYTPIRYAWDLQHQYLRESGLDRGLKGWVAKWMLHRIRLWDARTANGVDQFIADSGFIARRIWKVYRREATVIYPPVDVSRFTLHVEKEDFFLTASRMVPYKKMDLIVEAFSAMPDRRLVVIGEGPDWEKIRAKAGPNVTLLGYQPFDVLCDHMQRAKAFVFAAEEDFGITPVEAQACGTPVIAFGKGGALETVRDLSVSSPTGLFFDAQSVEALIDAVRLFDLEGRVIRPEDCRANAERFSVTQFQETLAAFIAQAWT
ncbi:MAG: glycosyltransferase family 4 protein, partial [Halothiobacillus sp.]|nr:glycosyltransferase family 4 protein [Halothiobacillus sp.]